MTSNTLYLLGGALCFFGVLLLAGSQVLLHMWKAQLDRRAWEELEKER